MARTRGESPRPFLPGWDDEEHVSLGRTPQGELEIRFAGACDGCRDSFPDMQRTIQTIAQRTAMTVPEATAFYVGFTVGVDSLRRYHRLGDFLDDDEILEDFFGGRPVAGRFH